LEEVGGGQREVIRSDSLSVSEDDILESEGIISTE